MKMISFFTAIFILVLECNTNDGNYYFDFDAIEYYNIKIDGNELLKMRGNSDLTKNEELQIDILLDDKPEDLNDVFFVEKLNSIGFVKKEIQLSKTHEINEIFKEKLHADNVSSACIAVYRDLLIFRKSKEIIGIAKLCFECRKNKILGTNLNTSGFGLSGDYSKLAKLLNE